MPLVTLVGFFAHTCLITMLLRNKSLSVCYVYKNGNGEPYMPQFTQSYKYRLLTHLIYSTIIKVDMVNGAGSRRVNIIKAEGLTVCSNP